MDQFNLFCENCLEISETESVYRNDIYEHYLCVWRRKDYNNLENQGEKYYSSTGEYQFTGDKFIYKTIGRSEFYKQLELKYGKPTIRNKKTKQFKYKIKLMN